MPTLRWTLASAVVLCVLFGHAEARAGGLYLGDRGVRPMGRGFAFVAGADDPGALWYNPAGLAHSGQQVLLDASMTAFRGQFTRIDGGGNTLPTVETRPTPIPIPTLGYTDDFGLDRFTFGAGVLAPNSVLFDWPSQVRVDGNARPAPQRYSLLSLHGTALAELVVGAAWRPLPELSIGITPGLLVGKFQSRVVVSACDRAICTQPENPEYDSPVEVHMPVVEPTLTLGATYDTDAVRLGLSMKMPVTIDGDATLRVRLPRAALFDGAYLDGDTASFTMDLPFILRLGAELRSFEDTRVEASVVYERWSRQQSLRIRPKNVWIRDVVGIGDYQMGTVEVPRNMNDVFSIRLGGVYKGILDGRFELRAGLLFETSAFDDAYLTPLTLDSTKVIASLGASVEVMEGIWIDASYGHVFMFDRQVRGSQVPQPNAIRPPPMQDEPPPTGPVHVGNGDYQMEADMFGLGVRWELSAPESIDPDTPLLARSASSSR